MTKRKTGKRRACVAAFVALVAACGGEQFTSSGASGGEAGSSKGGMGGVATSGGARANGGSNSSGGASGDGSGEAGEFGNGGSVGGASDDGGRAGSSAGESSGGDIGAAGGAGGARPGSGGVGGKAGGAGGNSGGVGNAGGLGGATGGKIGAGGSTGSGGNSGGAGGNLGGAGGTLGGSGGSIVVAGANAGGASSACQLPTGAVVLLDEPFNADVFSGGAWIRTDTSVSVSGGLFKIANDGEYDDYGDFGLSTTAPLVVEARLRNVSGGTEDLTPVVEMHFGTDFSGVVSISYNTHSGYGWIFGPPGFNTGSTIEAPAGEGAWTTIRAFLRVDGGILCAKRDDEPGFTFAASSTWQLPKAITHLRLRQSYDNVAEVDRVIVRVSQ